MGALPPWQRPPAARGGRRRPRAAARRPCRAGSRRTGCWRCGPAAQRSRSGGVGGVGWGLRVIHEAPGGRHGCPTALPAPTDSSDPSSAPSLPRHRLSRQSSPADTSSAPPSPQQAVFTQPAWLTSSAVCCRRRTRPASPQAAARNLCGLGASSLFQSSAWRSAMCSATNPSGGPSLCRWAAWAWCLGSRFSKNGRGSRGRWLQKAEVVGNCCQLGRYCKSLRAQQQRPDHGTAPCSSRG